MMTATDAPRFAPAPSKLYTSTEMQALTKLSYRRIDFWCRQGYLSDTANGSGSQRRFTVEDLDVVFIVGALIKVGFLPEFAFPIARKILADDRYATTLDDVFDLVISVRTDTTDTAEETTE